MRSPEPRPAAGRSRPIPWYRALAAVPAVAILAGVPLLNDVRGYVLGLPFLLFWIVTWVVLTSVVMAIVYQLDRRREGPAHRDGNEDASGPPTG
jgi:hypothetical protein